MRMILTKNKVITHNLVIRGTFKQITLMVYGDVIEVRIWIDF